jgi:hypothetical protein
MTRRSNSQPEAIAGVLRLLPAKWALTLIVVVIAYVLLQPRLNQWFGWQLPSVASILGQEATPAKTSSGGSTSRGNSRTSPVSATPSESTPGQDFGAASKSQSSGRNSAPDPADQTRANQPPTNRTRANSNQSDTSTPKGGPTPDKRPTGREASPGRDSNASPANQDLKFQFLKVVGRERYESPAGLLYNPGSEEGHRLKHIERHLSDQPNRPGSHGVFDGDMRAFLEAIDDTYKRARGHAKGTKLRNDDDATIYEAPFDRTLGFLGGVEGARRGHPKLKRMRIVVRDKNLITAFPIP